MLSDERGFTIMEALVGMTIISFIILLTLPLQHLIKMEREVLYDRRNISYYLHDELIKETNHINTDVRQPFSTKINNKRIFISFTIEDLYVKGCAQWTNAKQINESKCLYTFAKQ